MSIRLYQPADANACLSLFDSNVPKYFTLAERADFEQFLQRDAQGCDYQLIEHDDRVVACGGLAIRNDGVAVFCWGMVEHSVHRQGFGRQLSLARLQQARQSPNAKRVELSTSQHTQDFYAQLGFSVTRIVANGHGPGLDAVEMVLVLRED
ncbi:GNAT family N-acetyltransferase [uncultured Stenotrophomonas sp.]|uniref:GNAT family N-acetyltransferase n=1 Tax=uncultured Stenotrophomonas sp. TaxID=165438 RepID=UPI002600D093|nr:GNAT family N-acetyltransferase [uncultured Stenotrophomonas sp.]